jgi:hypothetical protein
MVEIFSRIDRGVSLVLKRYSQAIGHECNKNMCIDPLVSLVVNGPD